jgi:hypothetical protein
MQAANIPLWQVHQGWSLRPASSNTAVFVLDAINPGTWGLHLAKQSICFIEDHPHAYHLMFIRVPALKVVAKHCHAPAIYELIITDIVNVLARFLRLSAIVNLCPRLFDFSLD